MGTHCGDGIALACPGSPVGKAMPFNPLLWCRRHVSNEISQPFSRYGPWGPTRGLGVTATPEEKWLPQGKAQQGKTAHTRPLGLFMIHIRHTWRLPTMVLLTSVSHWEAARGAAKTSLSTPPVPGKYYDDIWLRFLDAVLTQSPYLMQVNANF